MPLTTTSGANAIREAYQPGFVEAVYRNNSLLGLFPAPEGAVGDTNVRWKVNSSGQTPEIFTEGQAQPVAGNQTYTNAAVAWNYFRGMVQVTGHAKDALQSAWLPAVEEEMTLLMQDIIDLITTTTMSGANGLETMVDSTTTYAGIARGAAAYWESTETAVSGALATSDLQDIDEAIRDNDKGGNPGLILCPWNQNTNIYRLTGTPFVQQGPVTDKSPGMLVQSFNGSNIVPLGDFANTVIMFLDMTPGKWAHVVIRDFEVKDMGPSGDSDVMQVSTGRILINKSPKLDGKLTGVTA
jgi:hypothetical protein